MKEKVKTIKKALIDEGYLTEQVGEGRRIPLPSIDGEFNQQLNYLAAEYLRLEKEVKSDDEESANHERYLRLLFFAMNRYIQGMSYYVENGQASGKDYEEMKQLKRFIDKNFQNKEDVLFMYRFILTEKSYRNRIWKKVISREMTTQEASAALKKIAYEDFLRAKNPGQKNKLLKIIFADKKHTDLEAVTDLCEINAEGKSPYYDRVYFDAKAVEDKDYDSYRETLQNMTKDNEGEVDIASNVPVIINQLFNGLADEAKKLYMDENESADTKKYCAQLLKEMDVYRVKLAEIESKKSLLSSAPEQRREEYEKEIKGDIEKLNAQAKKIERKIEKLSENTSSKRWGRITLIAGVILLLGLFTAGMGLIFGSDLVGSIRKESDFFVKKGEHHSVVTKARTLLKETESARVNLNLPEFSTKTGEDVEMQDMKKVVNPFRRDG